MTADEEAKKVPCHDNDNARISTPSARTIIEVKANVQGKGSSKAQSFDFLSKKYSIMKKELDDSRSRIEELEQSLVVRRRIYDIHNNP